jgi:hypothetical protein
MAEIDPIAVTESHPVVSYERPRVVDYGSLVDLTATNGVVDNEDGVGKLLHTDGSGGFIP